MTIGRSIRIAFAGVLVGCACALSFVALQAWRVPGGMQSRDAGLLGQGDGSIAWPASFGPVLTLLGAQDDVTYRRAVSLFLQARALLDPTSTRSSDAIVAAVEAEVVLARIENGKLDSSRRSEASNLDAVVIGQGEELEGNALELERAAVLLRSAIRLDRSDEAAKANLERLLGRLSTVRTGQADQAGIAGDKPGANPANQGY